MRGRMGEGCEREHGSFCHVCLTFVAKFIFLRDFAPFIAARF